MYGVWDSYGIWIATGPVSATLGMAVETDSAPSITVLPPSGYLLKTLSVDQANVDVDSFLYNVPELSTVIAGDAYIVESVTSPSGFPVVPHPTLGSEGVLVVDGVTQIETIQYSIYDHVLEGVWQYGTITINPPVDVTANINLVIETDTALPIVDGSPSVAGIGLASETDSALPVADGTAVADVIGQAQEADSALTVSDGSFVSAQIAMAIETDTALTVVDASPMVAAIGQAYEMDSALVMLDGSAVYYTIGMALETDSAFAASIGELPLPANMITIRIPATQTIIIR
jgi:hypothetical protein